MVSSEARTDDEGVYGEYTPRRTDEAVAETIKLQQKGELFNSL